MDIIDFLLKYPNNPLIVAVELNEESIARELLKRGVDPNLVDRYGLSAIKHAAYDGHLNLVKLLLDYKAEITDPCISVVIDNGRLDIIDLFMKYNVKVSKEEEAASRPLRVSKHKESFYKDLIPSMVRNSYTTFGECSLVDKIESVLGSGTYGVVYKSCEKAIKKMDNERNMDYVVGSLFCCPNIIEFDRVITAADYDIPVENVYMVSKLYREFDIESSTEANIIEILQGLYALSTLGYIHYDLNPRNILLDNFGHAVVADLGSCDYTTKGKIYTEREVCITDDYAPETYEDEYLSGEFQSVYAFGILCSSVYHKRRPFLIEEDGEIYDHLLMVEQSMKSHNVIISYMSRLIHRVLLEYEKTEKEEVFTKLPSFEDLMRVFGISPPPITFRYPEYSAIDPSDSHLAEGFFSFVNSYTDNERVQWIFMTNIFILKGKSISSDLRRLSKVLISLIYEAMRWTNKPIVDDIYRSLIISNLNGMLLPITGWNHLRPIEEILTPELWKTYLSLPVMI